MKVYDRVLILSDLLGLLVCIYGKWIVMFALNKSMAHSTLTVAGLNASSTEGLHIARKKTQKKTQVIFPKQLKEQAKTLLLLAAILQG